MSLMRTAAVVQDEIERLLRTFGITAAQYNVLRILRGAGSGGLGRNEIRDRLVTRMPDVTRLLDRMEAAGLVRRERDGDDRRCVQAILTPAGAAVLERTDGPVQDLILQIFGVLPHERLRDLIDALGTIRAP